MLSEKLSEIGTIVKTHGFKGEVVISASFEIPENFSLPEPVFLVIEGIPVPFFTEYYYLTPPDTIRLKLDTINDREEAMKYYQCAVMLEDSFLKKFKITRKLSTLAGFIIFDENNQEIGTVIGLMDIPMNPLLRVMYKKREVLLPVGNDMIVAFDAKQKSITLHIPEGLLD
ncbi:MAG: 16S rRNA processing protein RimM [Bacteroidetes bacterium HGW-Bacteroidetes-21]|jgi:16S rRNA processing protein RimM|nr:MAG: 16S rRNA processing protein RimM [Bacteroidetes bacterium HGW-Bacteroidetes-21]